MHFYFDDVILWWSRNHMIIKIPKIPKITKKIIYGMWPALFDASVYAN